MGMKLDEAIGLLERGSQYNYRDSAEDFCKAYDMAIEVMSKYQKIIDAMLMNDMVENIYFAIEEILKDDLEQDERFGK